MIIDQKTVEKMAHLSRLELSEQESEKMVGDLSKILNWMDQLKELDTTNVASPIAAALATAADNSAGTATMTPIVSSIRLNTSASAASTMPLAMMST